MERTPDGTSPEISTRRFAPSGSLFVLPLRVAFGEREIVKLKLK